MPSGKAAEVAPLRGAELVWHFANPTLRLTAYMGLLRSHLFEVLISRRPQTNRQPHRHLVGTRRLRPEKRSTVMLSEVSSC